MDARLRLGNAPWGTRTNSGIFDQYLLEAIAISILNGSFRIVLDIYRII
jgi:hypothetical protein